MTGRIRNIATAVGVSIWYVSAAHASVAADGSAAVLAPGSVQVVVDVDGERQLVPLHIDGSSVRLESDPTTLRFAHGDEVTLKDTTAEADPTFNISIIFTDDGAPSTVHVLALVTLVPELQGFVAVSANLRGTVTDGGSDGATLALFNPHIYTATANTPPIDLGVDLGSALSFLPPQTSATYGPFSAFNRFDCRSTPQGVCNSLRIDFSFTGSGGDDVYAIETTLVPAPEAPAPMLSTVSAVMLAAGLVSAGTLLLARRRHRLQGGAMTRGGGNDQLLAG